MRFKTIKRIINIRISEVKMQRSDNSQNAKTTHRRVQSSTTLNRKYVQKPTSSTDVTVSVKKSAKLRHFADQPMKNSRAEAQDIKAAEMHPLQATAIAKMQEQKMRASQQDQAKKLTAKELKDQAIKKALAAAEQKTEAYNDQSTDTSKKVRGKMHFGFGRIVLALSCAAAAVFAIVYFVNLNMPDISLRVAAMQTGLEASYPSYVPRNYSLSSITSEDGKITLSFENRTEKSKFSLVEEKSSWDSSALLSNYIRPTYSEDYLVIREQGLTIYISGNDAAWVNGGVVYKLTASETLTKKQIRSIAVSL